MAQLLSAEEMDRARTFRFEHLRDAFVVGRGFLRLLLARYLGARPAEIRIGYERNGKPRLEGAGNARLRFNLAHSGGLAAYALNHGRRIGIDIESIRPIPDMDRVMVNHFSPDEVRAIQAMPGEQRLAAFFACWTRKEAYVKAIGKGLAERLDGFTVSVEPGGPPRLVSVQGSTRMARRWTCADLHLGPGYRAALVVEGRISAIRKMGPAPVIDAARPAGDGP